MHICRGVRPQPNECPRYDTKQSDGGVPVILELWEVQSNPSLPSLLGPLWLGVVAPDKDPIYGLNWTQHCFSLLGGAFKLGIYAKLNCLKKNFWHLNCVVKLNRIIWNKTVLTLTLYIAQSAGVVEYNDCTSGEVPVILELWGVRSLPSLSSLPVLL